MKILLSAHNIAGIGSALRSFSLARWLVQYGHEVTVIASRRQPGLTLIDQRKDGVRMMQMPDLFARRTRNGGLSPMDLAGRMLFVLRNRFDVIHGLEPRPCAMFPGFIARKFFGTPFVADWCDLWGPDGIGGLRGFLTAKTLGRFDAWLERYTMTNADAIVSNNLCLIERAKTLTNKMVRLVRVGASYDAIRVIPRQLARDRLNVPQSAQVVVHTGFSTYDASLLTETFVVLAKRNPGVLMLMTGGELPNFWERIDAEGLRSQIRHFGFLPFEALADVLGCGDVMVLPYTNRTINVARFPIRIGDYFAAGRPTVTNNTGDLARIVEEEGVGVIASEDPALFAEAIQGLLDDPVRCEVMGKRARELAETKYSWRESALRLSEMYQDLTGKGGAHSRREQTG